MDKHSVAQKYAYGVGLGMYRASPLGLEYQLYSVGGGNYVAQLGNRVHFSALRTDGATCYQPGDIWI